MRGSQRISLLVTLLLLGVFTVCAFFTLSSGAAAYQGIVRRMENQYEERTCLNYIATKLRHGDVSGAVSITEYAGSPALSLREETEDTAYITLIYYYNGTVMELYTEKDIELTPDSGWEIIPAQALAFEEVEPGLLRISCTGESGRSASILLSLRAEGGAA